METRLRLEDERRGGGLRATVDDWLGGWKLGSFGTVRFSDLEVVRRLSIGDPLSPAAGALRVEASDFPAGDLPRLVDSMNQCLMDAS